MWVGRVHVDNTVSILVGTQSYHSPSIRNEDAASAAIATNQSGTMNIATMWYQAGVPSETCGAGDPYEEVRNQNFN